MGSAADNQDLAVGGGDFANPSNHSRRAIGSVKWVYQFVDDSFQPLLRVRRRFTPGAKQVDCRPNT